MLALSKALSVVLLLSGALLVAIALAALFLRGRAKERGPDIPAGMRPGPADASLETPLLHKLQGWSLVLVLFFAVWIPFSWLREPSENLKQEQDLQTEAISRGQRSVQLFSEENQAGVGCVRCHGAELRGSVIQAGVDANGAPAFVATPNLTTVCGGPSTNHPLIKSLDDIYTTLEQGRGVMPSWSIKYKGALDDQQIDDIVQYLVFMSSKNVPFEQNVCLNLDAADAAASPSAAASGEASASPSAAASAAASSSSEATP
ncbi:MAG: c-type cytochrome [Actinomycetota bacterium]